MLTLPRILTAALALQLLTVAAPGVSRADDKNITVTVTQQGSDLDVSWTPVPETAWPPSNAGGPWTTQMFFVDAWDMNSQAPRRYYYCDGSSGLAGQTGHPVTVDTSCVFRNLPLGKTYNVAVYSRVANAGTNTGMAGWGDLWTRGGVTLCCSVPSEPRDVRLIDRGSDVLTAVWSPSAESGGAGTLSYTVTLTPGGKECTTSLTECTFTGLQSGVQYSVSARAVNQAGQSVRVSSGATALRPSPLSAPRALKVALVSKGLLVSWAPPRLAKGQTVSRYVVRATPTGRSCTTMKTTCKITGLAEGRTYTVTVSLVDGTGQRSTSIASRPATIPAAKKTRPAEEPSPRPQEIAKPIVPVS